MMLQSQVPCLTLDGAPIAFRDLCALADRRARVRLEPAQVARVAAGRASLDAAIARGQPIYGTTTGVGAMKAARHHGETAESFAQALPWAHQVAVGENVPSGIARLVLVLRLNTALTGQAGVSPGFVQFLARMLHHDLLPVLHARGSVGCADLGQMGELATVMTGEGAALLGGEILPAAEALRLAGLRPYLFLPREGLAAVGTNAFGLARAALVTRRAARGVRRAMAQAVVSAAAMGLDRTVWQAARASLVPSEPELADWLIGAAATQGAWPPGDSVHDPLSGRFLVQVLAAAVAAVEETARSVVTFSGQVDDNPQVLGPKIVTSGASLFLGLSLRLSGMQLALAHLGRNLFNRCLLLTGGQLPGLPVNLVPPGIVATGYGPLMKLALDQLARITAAAAPVSLLNHTLAAGLEDEALLIPLAAEKIDEQLEALDWLLAIEALVSVQALALRGAMPDGVAELLRGVVRRHLGPMTGDVPLSQPLAALRAELDRETTLSALIAAAPFPPFDGEMALSGGGAPGKEAVEPPG